MIDIFLWSLAGICAGIVAGILPGIHPNTFIAGLLAVLPWLLTFTNATALAVFVISCVISNSFVSFIPSVFIGAPEAETALSVLPGHKMMLEGKGYEAVWLTVFGGISVIVLSIALAPALFLILPYLYQSVRDYMFWLIALVAAIMLWTESGLKRFWGLAIFTLSGILGLLSLNSPLMPSQWILFPIFTGLFGMPTLELAKSEKVPKQTMLCVSLDKISAIFGTLKGWLSGMIVGILPGIGPAQAAAVVQETTKRRNIREFLIAIGGITTVSTFFSLLALYLINKPRSGAAIALQHIIGNFGFREMAILLMTTLFVTGISVFVTLKLTKIFAQFIQKVNYKKLNLTIILLLIILVLLLTGPIGLFIMAVANAIGIIAPLVGTKRTHAMGVLMLPIMFFYFPL